MTNVLHLPARAAAPIACDMSSAPDTPGERLQEYERLFERALLQRERRPGAVVFRFRPEARAAVEDLARREAACCPFLGHRVEAELIWTITGDERAEAVLDAFHDLPDLARCRCRSGAGRSSPA